MTQQIINEEGAFSSTQRLQINNNFTELYGNRVIPIGQLNDVSKTSDTTLQTLSTMTQTISTQGIYNFEINMQINCTINGGISVALNTDTEIGFSCAITAFTSNTVNSLPIFRNGGTGTFQLINSSDAVIRLWVIGGLEVVKPGIIQIQGAQNTSSVDTTTFYGGSTFILSRSEQF